MSRLQDGAILPCNVPTVLESANKAGDLFLVAVGTWTVQSDTKGALCTLLPAR